MNNVSTDIIHHSLFSYVAHHKTVKHAGRQALVQQRDIGPWLSRRNVAEARRFMVSGSLLKSPSLERICQSRADLWAEAEPQTQEMLWPRLCAQPNPRQGHLLQAGILPFPRLQLLTKVGLQKPDDAVYEDSWLEIT